MTDRETLMAYRDLIEPSGEEAIKAVEQAREFLTTIRNCCDGVS